MTMMILLFYRLEMGALSCLGNHVTSNCSEEDMTALKDTGVYSGVTQYFIAVSTACYEYIDGNTVR